MFIFTVDAQKDCFVTVAFYVHVTLQHHDQNNNFIHPFEVFCKVFQVGDLTGKGQESGAKEHLGSARSGERSALSLP